MQNVIKVALADDHTLFRQAIIGLLTEANIEIVIDAYSGESLLLQLSKLSKSSMPDIFLIDINMPEMNGLQLTEKLRALRPDAKIIMLTMHNNKDTIMDAVKLGVKGYITKDKPFEVLIDAIRAVTQNKLCFPEEILKIIVESHQTGVQVQSEPSFPSLSQKEIEFLKLISSELTYKEIAERLSLSTRTVDGYRESLFEKFKVASRVGLVMAAIKMNLITLD